MKIKSIKVAVISLFLSMLICLLGCSNIPDNSAADKRSVLSSESPRQVEDNNCYNSYSVTRNPAGRPVKSSDGFEYSMFDTRQVNKGRSANTNYSSNSNPYEDGYDDGYEEGYLDAQREFEQR